MCFGAHVSDPVRCVRSIAEPGSDEVGWTTLEYDVQDLWGNIIDDVYKFPCPCGGTRVPPRSIRLEEAHLPDPGHSGTCGGTVRILVGSDSALRAYKINGQSIALEVSH